MDSLIVYTPVHPRHFIFDGPNILAVSVGNSYVWASNLYANPPIRAGLDRAGLTAGSAVEISISFRRANRMGSLATGESETCGEMQLRKN